MSNFICIQFGHSEVANHWYNCKTAHSSARSAERYGIESMVIAGQFGFAIIEDMGDTWKVLDDLSMLPPSGFSIGCKNHSYSIQPSPQLALV